MSLEQSGVGRRPFHQPIANTPGTTATEPDSSAVFHRSLSHKFLRLSRGKRNKLFFEDGRSVIDASGGASVACIGHGDPRVKDAIAAQLDKISYCATIWYTTDVCEELCQQLVSSTHGNMTKALIVSSGSEAMEAAMKLARQFFLENPIPEPHRVNFIARQHSYHDAGESCEQYVSRLAQELDAEFQRIGPETVCAFVAEPVVGAALGAVPAVTGYFKAMRQVCDKYGALLILDEVMCGMGRTGTLHAWEQEGVVPDIQTLGKCLGGGYQPIAAVLVNAKVVDVLSSGTGAFVHGHTYQGHPIACAAALEVQKIIKEEKLLENVQTMGSLLSRRLIEGLSRHPNVGRISGRGLFWGIEFVANKETREPFPVASGVAMNMAELGLNEAYGIAIYPGTGTADGVRGDHVIISPAYNSTAEEVEEIASIFERLVTDFFGGNKAKL
ncbi:hypothetical protein TruAng_008712 [Truncatella angustata]|nr:hypothetical protein TruAng_008712 [Truncatella angustata]